MTEEQSIILNNYYAVVDMLDLLRREVVARDEYGVPRERYEGLKGDLDALRDSLEAVMDGF